MRRLLSFVVFVPVALAMAGCPSTPVAPPVDVRAVHLAQVPAELEFVAQGDLSRVLDTGTVERWVGWMLQIESITVDPACAIALLGRAEVFTEAVLPGAGRDEDAMVLVSGDLTAADVAACAAQLLGREVPAPDAEGAYDFSLGDESMLVADFPAAGGVVIATPAGLALARGPAPAAEAALVGAPLYQRLRSLLGAGPFDLDAYVTMAMESDGFGAEGVGLTLQRGTADRYEIAILAGDADSANAIAMFAASLPLVLAGIEAQLGAMAEAPEELPLAGAALTESIGVVAAVREALTAAQTTVEGDVVRVVLELDPAKASPAQLLVVSGMMLMMRGTAGGDTGVQPPPPVERLPNDDYGVPGVTAPAVDEGQPPVE
jgi:hypothetical protein